MKSNDEFVKHGTLMFLACNIGNVLNMAYQLYMVRALSPVDYGILNSLLALFMIMTVPAGTLQTAITKFTAGFHAHNKWNKIKLFLSSFIKKVLIFGAIFFLFIVVSSRYLSSFFQIESIAPVIIVGLIMLLSVVIPITMGGMQGLQMFGWLGFNGIVNAGLKLALGVFLVALGFRVLGALSAFFAANFAGFLLSYIPIKNFIKSKLDSSSESDDIKNSEDGSDDINFTAVYKYFIPVTVVSLCFMGLINGDIILVKHYFTPLEAGYYSVAQMIGKIIIFLPMSIIGVMFPKVSNLHAQGKNTIPVLLKTLIVSFLLCAAGAGVCIMFPSLIIKILSGKEYPECIALARLFPVAMTFFALMYTLLFYQLAMSHLKFMYPLIFLTILQSVLIAFFHSRLTNVLYILCFISCMLFIVNLLLIFKPGFRGTPRVV